MKRLHLHVSVPDLATRYGEDADMPAAREAPTPSACCGVTSAS